MSDIIQEVPVTSIEAPVEQTESTEAPVEQVPVPATLMPKVKGRPKGVKDATIRKRRPAVKAPSRAPPPSEASSSEDLPPIDMRSRKQRTYDSWFD